MYQEYRTLTVPDEDSKIWRYLDITKFISMLKTKSLYFRRSDKLEDPFEGSLPLRNFLLRKSECNIDEQSLNNEAFKKSVFINCWHINEHESAAMWKVYLKSDEGIAIQSSFQKLVNSFNNDTEYVQYIGQVKYIDYKSDKAKPRDDILAPFFHKRKSFEYEHELRVVLRPPRCRVEDGEIIEIFDPNREDEEKWKFDGINVKVNLDSLIEKIYVSPKSEKWFKDVVESILNKYELNKIVEISPLAEDSPLY